MNKYANNVILRSLVDEYDLKHRDVAELLTSEYGLVAQKTIERWIYDYTPMPGPILELLQLKIKGVLAMQQHDQDR